jgi:hypothetical protein
VIENFYLKDQIISSAINFSEKLCKILAEMPPLNKRIASAMRTLFLAKDLDTELILAYEKLMIDGQNKFTDNPESHFSSILAQQVARLGELQGCLVLK